MLFSGVVLGRSLALPDVWDVWLCSSLFWGFDALQLVLPMVVERLLVLLRRDCDLKDSCSKVVIHIINHALKSSITNKTGHLDSN